MVGSFLPSISNENIGKNLWDFWAQKSRNCVRGRCWFYWFCFFCLFGSHSSPIYLYMENDIDFFNKNKNSLFKIDDYEHLFQEENSKLKPITIGNNINELKNFLRNRKKLFSSYHKPSKPWLINIIFGRIFFGRNPRKKESPVPQTINRGLFCLNFLMRHIFKTLAGKNNLVNFSL